jgi:iron complex transport system substrate-binding protein
MGGASVAGAALIGVSGCGAREDGSTSGGTRTVEHALGRAEVPAEPRRIVSMDAEETLEALLALGLQPVAAARPPATGGIPGYVMERVKGKLADIGISTQPNLEAIAALEPDLIVGASEDAEAIYPRLSEIAPTVVWKTDQSDWRSGLRKVAGFLGAGGKAEGVISAFERRARRFRGEIEARGGATASAVRLISGTSDLYLLTPESFTGSVLADAGLAVPEAQRDLESPDPRYVQLSEERIPLLDADYIFVCLDEDAGDVLEKLRANPLWSRLKGEVVEVDSARWVFGSVLSANAILDDLKEHLPG